MNTRCHMVQITAPNEQAGLDALFVQYGFEFVVVESKQNGPFVDLVCKPKA